MCSGVPKRRLESPPPDRGLTILATQAIIPAREVPLTATHPAKSVASSARRGTAKSRPSIRSLQRGARHHNRRGPITSPGGTTLDTITADRTPDRVVANDGQRRCRSRLTVASTAGRLRRCACERNRLRARRTSLGRGGREALTLLRPIARRLDTITPGRAPDRVCNCLWSLPVLLRRRRDAECFNVSSPS